MNLHELYKKHKSGECNNCSFCKLEKKKYYGYLPNAYIHAYEKFFKDRREEYPYDTWVDIEYFNTFSTTKKDSSFIDYYKRSILELRKINAKKINEQIRNR